MTYKKIFFILIVQCLLCLAQAQKITVPFQYGFEKGDKEKDNWELNIGDRGRYCTDRWYIGNLEHSEGSQALYISCDRGKTSNYGATPTVVVASRTLELETGNYDISFDWRVWGEASISELYVCALPDDYVATGGESLGSNDTIGYFPKLFSRFIKTLTTVDGDRQALSGATTWTNASFQMSVVSGRKVRLAFVWVNANQDSTISSPLGACIDNIQINSAMCPKPENLRAEASCGVLKLMWDGIATKYECGYKRIGGKGHWNNEYDIEGEVDQPQWTWDNVEEGAYDVRVRAILDEDTSAYVYLNTVVIWCPDNHCFDFVSLDNKEIVSCFAGGAIMSPLEGTTEYTFAQCPPIDFGSSSIHSRHTTNWDQTAVDPRTGNKLRLVPENELASVRLGNWNSGAQAERLTYNLYVDEDKVLLMKYAVVLEKPGHGVDLDPYFGLEIFKEDGTSITENAICGEAFFSPDKDPDQWRIYGDFVWKDWTTIGIDLRSCKGENVIIQLTTQDCYNGGHGGYAYFTLDCIEAVIKSDGCEDITLEAPDGFRYLWTNPENSDFKPTTKQSIIVSAGDFTTYYCEINYLDNDDCSFTLASSVLPFNPKAAFNDVWAPKNCNNIVEFKNKSYVYANVDGVDSIIQNKSCERYEWEFTFNGKKTITDLVSPRFTVPNEGGNLNVKLTAFLGDDKCQDILDTTIVVAPIYAHDVKIDTTLCFGYGYILGDHYVFESGVYVDTFLNRWGCDSVVTLDLTVRNKIEDTYFSDTICSDEPYLIGGYRLDSTGTYELLLQTEDNLKCDSVVFLDLVKFDPLVVSIEEAYRFVCADDSILYVDYVVGDESRKPIYYSVVFDSLALANKFVDIYMQPIEQEGVLAIPLPSDTACVPNTYSATLLVEDTISACGSLAFPIEFDVYYSDTIMQTKFGNMIVILNSKYNGGHSFDWFQWYENGVKLEDQTSAYLSLGEGKYFAPNDCYTFEAKRSSDGVVMRACEICPGINTPVDEVLSSDEHLSATMYSCGQYMQVNNAEGATISLYTTTGQKIYSIISNSELVEVMAPTQLGIYLLEIRTQTNVYVTKIIVN